MQQIERIRNSPRGCQSLSPSTTDHRTPSLQTEPSVDFHNLVMCEDPPTGFIEIADSKQHMQVKQLVDTFYGISSALMNSNVNDVRAEMLKRHKERSKNLRISE